MRVTCAVLTGVSGAGIMLMADDVAQGSLCTTDPTSALIEQVQYTLGEGPCVDAHRQGRPILEPDLAGPGRAGGPPSPNRSWPPVSGRSSASRCGWGRPVGRPQPLPGPAPATSPTTSTPTRSCWPTWRPRRSCSSRPGRRQGRWRTSWPDRPTSTSSSTRPPAWSRSNSGSPWPTRSSACGPTPSPYDRPLRDVADDVVARRLQFDTQRRLGGTNSLMPIRPGDTGT